MWYPQIVKQSGSQEITPISTTDYANLTPQQKSNGQVYLVSPTPMSPDYTASNWQFASEYASAYTASIDDNKLVFKILSGSGNYNSYACAMYKTGIDLTNVDHITLIANITYIGSPREIQIGVIDTLPSLSTYNPTFSSYETLTEGSWTLPIDKTIELDTSALTGTYYFGVKASGKTEFTAESILFYFDNNNIPNEIYHMNQKFSQYPTSSGASALDDLTDVDIATPSDGQVLSYNSTSGKWENSDSSGGYFDITGTLTAGSTSITLGNDRVTATSTTEVFTDTPDVDYNTKTMISTDVTSAIINIKKDTSVTAGLIVSVEDSLGTVISTDSVLNTQHNLERSAYVIEDVMKIWYDSNDYKWHTRALTKCEWNLVVYEANDLMSSWGYINDIDDDVHVLTTGYAIQLTFDERQTNLGVKVRVS